MMEEGCLIRFLVGQDVVVLSLLSLSPGLRTPVQDVHAEHGVDLLQEDQPRVEAPGTPAGQHYNVYSMNSSHEKDLMSSLLDSLFTFLNTHYSYCIHNG